MTIDEIKAKKRETEQAIRELLLKFSTDCGVQVHGVDFTTVEAGGVGGPRVFVCRSCNIDVRL